VNHDAIAFDIADDNEHFMVAVDNNAPGRLVKFCFHDETVLPFAIWVRVRQLPL
jgi:hypothetical protein